MNDQALAFYNAYLHGEKRALEQLVTLESDNLIRFAYLYVRDSAVAEDIAEDVFVTLIVKRKPFEERAKFRTYLFKIARNKCLDYLRRNAKKVPLQDVETVLQAPSFEQTIEDKENNRTLYLALAQLPKQYREVLHLNYFEELSVPEICAVTKQTAKQVYNLLSRAKLSLKQELTKYGVTTL